MLSENLSDLEIVSIKDACKNVKCGERKLRRSLAAQRA
jgi:hypothetical protein